MFTNGFVLSNVEEMRILIVEIHILHHLMDNAFLLEAFLR